MKKILLLLLLPFIGFAQLPETFDTEIPSTWAIFPGTNGEGTAQTWQHNSGGYVYCSYEAVTTMAEDWLVSPQVAVTASTSILSFLAADNWTTDYGSTYQISVSTTSQTDISTFTTVATYTEADMTHGTFSQKAVDLSAYIGQSVYIAFVFIQNDGDVFFLDDVELVADASAPNPVTTPTPADGATNVLIDPADDNGDSTPDNSVNFSWVPATTGDAPSVYNFYFGTDPSAVNYLGSVSGTSVELTGLTENTLYYWSVVASNVGGDAVGSAVWSFTTGGLLSTDSFDNLNNKTSIYPNPAKAEISINLADGYDVENTSITIVDVTGKVVANFKSIENVNVQQLPKGVYFVKITDGKNTINKKLIKE